MQCTVENVQTGPINMYGVWGGGGIFKRKSVCSKDSYFFLGGKNS